MLCHKVLTFSFFVLISFLFDFVSLIYHIESYNAIVNIDFVSFFVIIILKGGLK
uniref:Uncharacterized protein n=1 Tax=Siphoviridae sp. ctu9a31 TaxID=2825712 RepID=A0A8S5QAL4_9CAUD|nr:MAG TPA: hypothetical protein [Siphoviridae sp. ctu9a31]DAG33494.1 MAG TPA: hypothetical protein [Caudoviricetes sp.]